MSGAEERILPRGSKRYGTGSVSDLSIDHVNTSSMLRSLTLPVPSVNFRAMTYIKFKMTYGNRALHSFRDLLTVPEIVTLSHTRNRKLI